MRATTGFLLWLVAAAVATAVGLVAVSAIGTDIFGGGQDPLSQSQVDDLLASSSSAAPPPTTSSAQTTTTPLPRADGTTTVTEAGTVISRCAQNGLVEVVSATPAQGFWVDGDDELDDHPSVKFRSGDTEVEVRLRCVGGVPQAEVKYDD